ncbi:MAG: hypothetical protein AABZ84_01260 [Pseudomonadota bacterium]
MNNTIPSIQHFSKIIGGEVCWLDNRYTSNARPSTEPDNEDYLPAFTYEDPQLNLAIGGREIALPSNLHQAANLIDDEKELYIF